MWTIEVIANTNINLAIIQIFHGLEKGKLTEEITEITEGKNTGKANETTFYTQALAEAQSKINGKIRKGYVIDKKDLRESSILGSGSKEPMLAYKYDPTEKQSGSKNLKKIGIENKQIFCQKKKDGNRMCFKVSKDGVEMRTRKGDLYPTEGLEHIANSVLTSFCKLYDYVNKKYGVTEYTLDGELYTKAFSFNKLNGLCKKKKKDEQDLIDCKQIEYHIYDVMIDAGYETRYKIIQNFKSESVHIEEAFEVTATDANIKKYLEMFLAEGEEGLMIRQLGIPYENKRSWQLIKVKLFEDAEFKIVGFEQSVKGGMAGNIVVAVNNPCFDRTGTPIKTFKAGLKFSHEEATEMWNNQNKYIGKLATIEYFGVSEYGIPRFPKVIKIGRIDA